MGIPSPDYDSVLLREHLYKDLKKHFLVLPPEAKQGSFKSISDIGLGLFQYKFADEEEVTASSPSLQGIMWRIFLRHFIAIIVLSIVYSFLYQLVFRRALFGRWRWPVHFGHFRKISDIEEAVTPPLMTCHTPVPSLSFSPGVRNEDLSESSSPENVYIKTTNISDSWSRFKPENEFISGIHTVKIR
ncbi:hypothetical protein FOA43_003550 [Brettanomyces nanus]|uniref:Uncharacterized protein n=1 Tax=Eeniella nana TaxID=13502 RepID=A0A875SB66_EENNA|nr:uncharacterized protein FOA43_003550 [Brettanomyces nanus]QPG76164.1 hypothetical protein FOA43_003550 [Brettanomyces nanus]